MVNRSVLHTRHEGALRRLTEWRAAGPWAAPLYTVGLGDFNCSMYLGIQVHLYIRQINLGPTDNKAFNKADIP